MDFYGNWICLAIHHVLLMHPFGTTAPPSILKQAHGGSHISFNKIHRAVPGQVPGEHFIVDKFHYWG